MAHEHAHYAPIAYAGRFAIGIGLNVVFVIAEVAFGLMSNSSALLADAGHNISDIMGLAFAWAATWMATIRPKGKYTYGLRKTTILVSILNALLLFGAVAIIAWDAFGKLKNPQPIAGTSVMIVAGFGILINTITALLFYRGQKTDLNIKGAFLHMAADAGVSLGVVIAGLFIHITGKMWIDPAVSFVIILVILWGTWRLFAESLNLALDAVPKHLKIEKVRDFLLQKEGVTSIHDLHIWAMSTTQVALTVHLVVPGGASDMFITRLQQELSDKFGIGHTTFQIESKDLQTGNCNGGCPPGA